MGIPGLSFIGVLFLVSTLCGFSIDHMTIEEKVGQLLMPCFIGLEANDDAKALIQETHVGGIIYYNASNGLHSPCQVQTLSNGLQEFARDSSTQIPLLIAVDQEGGVVTRLKGEGFTAFPGAGALGAQGDFECAKSMAFLMGLEMGGVGINLNLAPVVDVNSNPNNPVIGSRSYGSDPHLVTQFGQVVLEGFHAAGIATTLKHYPGHGDTASDSHYSLPVIDKSLAEMECNELVPFKHLVNQTEAIMTAHLMVPALDSDHCSTLSKRTLSYLREELGFKGVIISDSLTMAGVLCETNGNIAEAAIAALNAGCDVLLLGGRRLEGSIQSTVLSPQEVATIHHAILEALVEGRILETRVDEAVSRILSLKAQISLFSESSH